MFKGIAEKFYFKTQPLTVYTKRLHKVLVVSTEYRCATRSFEAVLSDSPIPLCQLAGRVQRLTACSQASILR